MNCFFKTCFGHINPIEAAWRILGFPMHERFPSVAFRKWPKSLLQPNNENSNERFANPPKITLTAFLKLCLEDPEAANLFYADVPTTQGNRLKKYGRKGKENKSHWVKCTQKRGMLLFKNLTTSQKRAKKF